MPTFLNLQGWLTQPLWTQAKASERPTVAIGKSNLRFGDQLSTAAAAMTPLASSSSYNASSAFSAPLTAPLLTDSFQKMSSSTPVTPLSPTVSVFAPPPILPETSSPYQAPLPYNAMSVAQPALPAALATQAIAPLTPTQAIAPPTPTQAPVFVNRLKNMLRDGESTIYALNIRTFGAEDKNGDGKIVPEENESGTFLSCIPKLDALKAMGFNTIHLLPINPPGKENRLGEAGSIYAPGTYEKLNPEFGTPYNNLSIEDEAKLFVQACHERGIHVMVDVPSCASEDLAKAHPELVAVDGEGKRLTPGTWIDIVAFANNQPLQEYYEKFFTLMADKVGVDGFRCDVARFRTDEFWQHFITKYPEKGWFAESYIEEDDSPIPNIPRDRPWALLKDGFDTYYGQFHIFHQWSANEYLNYISDEKKRMLSVGEPRAFTGTFYTHDDPSMMKHGGVPMFNLSSAMMCLQPFTNPYVMDGYLTADPDEYNIFDYVGPAKGEHPEVGLFLKEMLAFREANKDVIVKGSFTPLPVTTSDNVNQVIAYARTYQDKTLVVLANKDLTQRHEGLVNLPGLNSQQPLQDQVPHDERFPATGQSSQITAQANALQVNLEPGAIHAFFVSTPNLEHELPTLYNKPNERPSTPIGIASQANTAKGLGQKNYAELAT